MFLDGDTYGLQSHPSMEFVYLDRKIVLDPLHLFVLVYSASDSSESGRAICDSPSDPVAYSSTDRRSTDRASPPISTCS